MTVETECRQISAAFQMAGEFVSSAPYGSGHINQTFLVVFNQAGSQVRYILQKINHLVFRNVPGLMENIQRVTSHANARLAQTGAPDQSRQTLTVVPTRDGAPYLKTAEGEYWRVYYFIERAKTYDRVQNSRQAYEAARAFGKFQRLLSDLPGERLHETIPDFHHTRARFEALQRAIGEDIRGRAREVQKEIAFFRERESETDRLIQQLSSGILPERITHNDCKLNNVMLDDATGEGICVIDLDTVMPGTVLYDFGDMVRTSTSPVLEDEKDSSKVIFQMEMFEALVRGYLAGAGDALVPAEIDQLAFSGKLITMEIGIRFLTDYLQGDTYFRTHYEGHNLVRCRTQIGLAQSIEENLRRMEEVVRRERAAAVELRDVR